MGRPVESELFNRFDAALCDAVPAADLRDFLVAALDIFVIFVFARATDFARVARLDEGLEDFLRVFWDIRLPFVAFGGSIIRPLRLLSGEPKSSQRLCKSGGAGVWLQEVRRTFSLVKGAVSAK